MNNNNKSEPKFDSVADDWRITAYVFDSLTGEALIEFEELIKSNEEYTLAVSETRKLVKALESEAIRDAEGTPNLSATRVTSIEKAIATSSFTDADPVGVSKSATSLNAAKVLLLAVAASTIGIVLWLRFPPEQDHVATIAENAQKNTYSPSQSTSPNQSSKKDLITPENSADRPEPILTLPETNHPFEPIGNVEPDSGIASLDDFSMTVASKKELEQNHDNRSPSPGMGNVASGEASIEDNVARGTAKQEGMTVAGDAVADRRKLQVHYGSHQGSSGNPAGNKAEDRAAGLIGGGVTPATAGGYPGMADGYSRVGAGYPVEGGGYPVAGQGMGGMGEMGGTSVDNPDFAAEGMMGGYPGHPGLHRTNPVFRGRASGDAFAPISDNPFQAVTDKPLSTFSIDVDTASYSKIRMMLQRYNQLPQPNSVRIEELLNYFSYDYAAPEDHSVPFAANLELAACPWNDKHKLARIAIKGREIETNARSVSNLVFLLDVSGSMNEPDKLPLLKRGMEMLVSQLSENDRVAIVVYAGAAGLILESTTADQKDVIYNALDRLQAGGSTNGGQGIQLAYQIARDHFIEGGTNRVILCTDGDFNVGTTGTQSLVDMVANEAKGGIFLSVLGFGTGNLNDAMLEAISGRGDGNYAFIDSTAEAHKVLVQQLSGTLVTIAKDVKIQIEFNPMRVEAYRLIGYENRLLAAKDFADDTKDAGEIGAGHTVTALYEIVPVGSVSKPVENLRYQPQHPAPEPVVASELSDELLVLKLRYKEPEGGASKLLEFPIKDEDNSWQEASNDFKFAASVASFGMLLRNSPHLGNATFESTRNLARSALADDQSVQKSEFLGLVGAAARLKSEH